MTARQENGRRNRLLSAGLLAGVSAAALAPLPAAAGPANGVIVAGAGPGAGIDISDPANVIVTQTTGQMAIQWDSFSIANGESVVFNQPGNQAIALNRVVGSGGPIPASIIDGILQANGHVWLINPAGIAFGTTANVDVGGLLATTADIGEAAFMATDPATGTFAFAGTGTGTVVNAGDIDAQGLVALVAPVVVNSGDLASSHGDVLLGAADSFRIRFAETARGSGAGAFNELLLTDFIVDAGSSGVAAGGNAVSQTAAGTATGGRVIATASRSGGGAFLNMEGLVEAQDVGALSGDVFLLGGSDIAGGTIAATATDAVRIDNATLVAPGTATVQGTAVSLGSGSGPLASGGGGSALGSASVRATTGDVTLPPGLAATTGTLDISAANGTVSTGDLSAAGDLTVSGTDVDLTGAGGVLQSSDGAVSVTATAGDISSAGVLDIDGDSVTLAGPVTATAVDIDADAGAVTADAVTATAGAVSIDATGDIAVDDLAAATTARAVSSGGAVDVGDVTAPDAITVSGTDVDLTGAGGVLQSSDGAVSVTATAGDISSAGVLDIDGDSVTLAGPVTATGSIAIDADAGDVSVDAAIASLSGAVSVIAQSGMAMVDSIQVATTVTLRALDVAVSGAVTAGTSALVEATLADVSIGGLLAATTGAATVTAATGDVDLAGVQAGGAATVSARDIDLTAPVTAGGIASLTATAGDISSAASLAVMGSAISLGGPVNGATGIDLTATTGNIAANAPLTSSGGGVTTAAAAGDIDVTSIAAANGVTLTARDIDLSGPVDAGTGTASLTATAGNVSSIGLLDIDGAGIVLGGPVSSGAGVDLDAGAGGISSTGSIGSASGTVDIASTGPVVLAGVASQADLTIAGSGVTFTGPLSAQGQVSLTAQTGNLSGTGSVTAPNGTVTGRAPLGLAQLNDVTNGGDLDLQGGAVLLTGTSTVGGKATLRALLGNVEVAGSLTVLGGIMLIDAPGGSAVINRLVSDSEITFAVLDLDLTGSLTAGDQINLASGASGTTIVLGGDGGSGGLSFRRAQGFTLDADELARIHVKRLQFDAAANDLALLDATFDPAVVKSVVLGANSDSYLYAGGRVHGVPLLQLGFAEGSRVARPELVFVSGALGTDTPAGRMGEVRIESSGDIVIGTQAFLENLRRQAAAGGIHLAELAEPDLASLGGMRDHVFIAADRLRLMAPGEIAQLNTGTGAQGKGVVIATDAAGTIRAAGAGPRRVNLFGVVIRPDGTRATSFSAGLENGLLAPDLPQNGKLRFNLCVIGNSASCSNAILREAQESARSRNSDLSSLTHAAALGFERGEFEDEDKETDPGGVAGAGNEGLWGVGLP